MCAMTKTSETCCHQKPPECNLGRELAQALHAPKRNSCKSAGAHFEHSLPTRPDPLTRASCLAVSSALAKGARWARLRIHAHPRTAWAVQTSPATCSHGDGLLCNARHSPYPPKHSMNIRKIMQWLVLPRSSPSCTGRGAYSSAYLPWDASRKTAVRKVVAGCGQALAEAQEGFRHSGTVQPHAAGHTAQGRQHARS